MRASDDSPILGPLRLGVASVERSRDFYRAALGLETRVSRLRALGPRPLLLATLLFGWLVIGGALLTHLLA